LVAIRVDLEVRFQPVASACPRAVPTDKPLVGTPIEVDQRRPVLAGVFGLPSAIR